MITRNFRFLRRPAARPCPQPADKPSVNHIALVMALAEGPMNPVNESKFLPSIPGDDASLLLVCGGLLLLTSTAPWTSREETASEASIPANGADGGGDPRRSLSHRRQAPGHACGRGDGSRSPRDHAGG